MSFTGDPSKWYDWEIPDVGGNIGSWDTILNKVFGEDNADGDDDPSAGVDEVLFLLEGNLDTLKTDIDALLTRITTLELTTPISMGARVEMSGTQAIPEDVSTQLTFGTVDMDQGSCTTDTKAITVPASGAGAWQIRASVTGERHADSDDGWMWELLIKKNGTTIARKRVPWVNDGVASASSTITVGLSIIDPSAVETDVYTAWVEHSDEDGSPGSETIAVGTGTFLQGVRMTPEDARSFARSVAFTQDNTAATNHDVTRASLDREDGDIEVMVYVHRGTGAITTPTGWTALTTNDDGTMSGTPYYRRVTTGEAGGGVVNVVKSGTNPMAAVVILFRGMDLVNNPEDAANDGDGDPPALAVSWGATKTVYIAISATGEEESLSAAPTGYDATAGVAGSGSEPGIDAAYRIGKTASEDPGAFTYATAVDGICWTIGIEVA